jgi:hypothetical protein
MCASGHGEDRFGASFHEEVQCACGPFQKPKTKVKRAGSRFAKLCLL